MLCVCMQIDASDALGCHGCYAIGHLHLDWIHVQRLDIQGLNVGACDASRWMGSTSA